MTSYNLVAGRQPEATFHGGANFLICHISLSVSNTPTLTTDTYIVGKLPQGAYILDAVFYPGAANAAAAVFKVGTSASVEALFASASYSVAVYRYTVPKAPTVTQISISDDQMPRYENVVFSPMIAVSVGHVGDVVVTYKMPGQTL